MPLLIINTSLSPISQFTLETLYREGSQILSDEIGKSLDYCMVKVEEGCRLSFGQEWNQPSSYLEVKNVGRLSPDLTSRLSVKLSQLIEESMSVPRSRTYIEFQESERHLWGWNGKTFAD
jgi:phenylpyruvate tautomerase